MTVKQIANLVEWLIKKGYDAETILTCLKAIISK